MDADEDPPDSGWPVHPASAFYGLWPRSTADEDAGKAVSALAAEAAGDG